ncbi:hypothetical protein ACQR35_10890 [Pseudarthrobacter sp. J1738]|uniref:hypothetical protein n=1 Tax=Pseudarthrobacter sp. J1738 TaxID=3420446 RepID=UPI003D26A150
MHKRPPFHALRTATLAVASVSLSAGAHVYSGGALPPIVIVIALIALTGLASTLLTRIKLNIVTTTAALSAGQLALHEAFTAFQGTGSAIASTVQTGHHSVPALAAVSDHTAHSLVEHAQELSSAPGATMLMAHAIATICTGLLLAKGESALWALAAWLRPLVTLPLTVGPDVVRAPLPRTEPRVPAQLPWRNLRRDRHRGPPLGAPLPLY